MMSTRAHARGARGAVVNGGVRDIEQIAAREFPVYGTHRCVKDIRTRGFMHSFDVPVTCGGVSIAPGDFIYADANGVVSIPAHRVDAVLAACMDALSEEDATMRGLHSGESAQELFRRFGRF
jgi:4-hydroxy-4-methyl-2-oxoglutarate aldolase